MPGSRRKRFEAATRATSRCSMPSPRCSTPSCSTARDIVSGCSRTWTCTRPWAAAGWLSRPHRRLSPRRSPAIDRPQLRGADLGMDLNRRPDGGRLDELAVAQEVRHLPATSSAIQHAEMAVRHDEVVGEARDARFADTDGSVVVLVEMREELPGAHAQRARDRSRRRWAAPARGGGTVSSLSTCGPSSGRSIGNLAAPLAAPVPLRGARAARHCHRNDRHRNPSACDDQYAAKAVADEVHPA